MTKLLSLAFLSTLAFAGCSKKEPTCEDVFDHTVSLMPAELKDQAAQGKDKALAKCEKMSPEAKKCALDASSMEDLMKCPRS